MTNVLPVDWVCVGGESVEDGEDDRGHEQDDQGGDGGVEDHVLGLKGVRDHRPFKRKFL